MFASKHPLYFYIVALGIVGAVIATLFLTKNPLALLALFFIPTVPVVSPQGSDEDEMDDADGRGMGFTADV